MPKQITDQLTQVRNKAEHIFAFYRIDDEDMFTAYSKGEIEDTIFEVLHSDENLLDMFAAIVEEVYEFKAEQN